LIIVCADGKGETRLVASTLAALGFVAGLCAITHQVSAILGDTNASPRVKQLNQRSASIPKDVTKVSVAVSNIEM
jgi:hypothetical protein